MGKEERVDASEASDDYVLARPRWASECKRRNRLLKTRNEPLNP